METLVWLVGLLLIAVLALSLQIYRLTKRIIRNDNNDLEVQYFEYIEDSSGVVKNSKRYVIKAQIFYRGLPVGGQFVMSEHLIEEFSYEKLAKLKTEVITPIIGVTADVLFAAKSALPKASKVASGLLRNLKLKDR